MIIQAIIICLMVLCIWYTMQDGEIFGWLGNWFAIHAPYKIHPAIFECNVCMTPWYGTAIYFLLPWFKVGLPEARLITWPICIFIAMGLNIIINKLEQKEPEESAEKIKSAIDKIRNDMFPVQPTVSIGVKKVKKKTSK